MVAAQMELLADFPMESVKKRSLLAEFMDAYDKHGCLFPQNIVPKILCVSRERVSALIREGRIAVVKIGGRNYVPFDSFKFYCAEEHKAGRRVTVAIPKTMLRVADSLVQFNKSLDKHI